MPMPKDDDDDLYEDDFEFVDDDDDDVEADLGDPDDEQEDAPAPGNRRPAKKAKKPTKKKAAAKRKSKKKPAKAEAEGDEAPDQGEGEIAGEEADDAPADEGEAVDEFGRPEPVANYVVHVYEKGALKRTIDRDFTPEDAEAFATEYTRTSKSYRRFAVAGKKDTPPRKTLT